MHYRAIAEFYDAENEHNEGLLRDVPFFLQHLPRRRRCSVLELAVGTGRAAIPIAQAGHDVVGIDFDRDMLEIATRKRDLAGLRERELKLAHADVTRFDLRKRFDWVCIFFNTFLNFTTLDQQDAVLQRVRRHLTPRGKFWIDIFQPDVARLAEPHSRQLDPTLFRAESLGQTVLRHTEVRRDPAAQVQHITHHFTWIDDAGRERRRRVKFDLTFLFPRELRILLERNGLKIDKLYGDYDGSALDMDSPRMIAVASPMKTAR